MICVTTKKELREAVKRREPEIVVKGKLANRLKGFAKLKKLSGKQKAALIAFITGSGATTAAAIALAAPTGGLSVIGTTASFVAAAPAAGVSGTTALVVVALIVAVGLLTLVALLKGYDVDIKVGKDGTEIHFHAK